MSRKARLITKKNSRIAFPYILLGLASLMFTTLSMGIKSYQGTSQKGIKSQQPASTLTNEEITPTPYQSVENGVYTNYLYRFSFKYPEDIFVSFSNEKPWANAKNKYIARFIDHKRETSGYPDKYSMNLYVNDVDFSIPVHGGNSIPFSDYYNRKSGVPWFNAQEERNQNNNDVKVKNIKGKDFIGFIQYSYTTPYADEIEPGVGHEAVLKTNNLILSISISSPVTKEEDLYRNERIQILEEIISSVEFL